MSIPPNQFKRDLWLGGILIIAFWHIHFNKLLMPLTPVCCFANWYILLITRFLWECRISLHFV